MLPVKAPTKIPERQTDRGDSDLLVMSHFPWLTEMLPLLWSMGFPGGSAMKNPPANAEDEGSIPGLGRSPGGRHGNSLQYSYLENPLGRGAWWAIVHVGAKSWTWLKLLSTHVILCHEPLLVTMESTSSHQQGPTPPPCCAVGKSAGLWQSCVPRKSTGLCRLWCVSLLHRCSSQERSLLIFWNLSGISAVFSHTELDLRWVWEGCSHPTMSKLSVFLLWLSYLLQSGESFCCWWCYLLWK